MAERRYGLLEGRRRDDAVREFGRDRVQSWRRGWFVRPPVDAQGTLGESMHDLSMRVLPYWRNTILPELLAGRRVAVVGHGNSLRVIVRATEGLSEEDAGARRIDVGAPFFYRITSPSVGN